MTLRSIFLSCLLAFVCAESTVKNLIDTRIVGGKNAVHVQFPYQVSLQTGYPARHFCGGSIIDRYWILTAAHCIIPGKIIVKAGKYNINIPETNEQTASVEKIFKHELYAGEVGPYDIALLKLATPLIFNIFVNGIDLPIRNVEPTGNAILSGWGSISRTQQPRMTSILQWASLPLINTNNCIQYFNAFIASRIHSSNVCTGGFGQSACSGDSGGPLVITNINGLKEVVGIVSWGMIPCSGQTPSVYVKVSSFVDWINRKISTN